ncbi:TonB family protein [Brevundimonas sp. FT23042]|uniref:TonB family protein n=1 Tax=Brevundimonas sp. FT23042 TaxID=3393749 RepID=UPI003B588689
MGPALFATAAHAQSAPTEDGSVSPASPVIVNPAWERAPLVVYPERAMARGAPEGRVTAQCRLEPTGVLTECVILSETPADLGFGQAILDQAAQAKIRPRTVDGVPEATIMRWSVRFGSPMPEAD